MIEINTFPLRGLTVEVSSGDATTHAYIAYVEHDVNKKFLIESVSTAKSRQQINTLYYKYLRDAVGNLLNLDTEQKATYVPVTTYPEVYTAEAPSLGQKIDQIGINTVLYELHRVVCYDLITNTFAPPITADVVSTPCTIITVYPEPELDQDPDLPKLPPYNESNMDGTITVTPVDFVGALSYTIIELNQTNATGIFEGLDAGIYTVHVQSDVPASPYTTTVTVEASMPIAPPIQ